MPLIKSNQATKVTNGAVVIDFEDLGRQAARMMDDARNKASEVIAEAKRQAEQIRSEAERQGQSNGHDQGFEQGHAAGVEQGRADACQNHEQAILELVDQWQGQIKAFDDDRDRLLESCRTQAIQLSLAIARRIIYRVVHKDPVIVTDQLADALAMVATTTEVEVVIHPDQEGLVREVLPDICATLQQVDSVALTLDPALTPGGCLVRTRGGAIDGTIETQIDRIVDELIPSPYDGNEP